MWTFFSKARRVRVQISVGAPFESSRRGGSKGITGGPTHARPCRRRCRYRADGGAFAPDCGTRRARSPIIHHPRANIQTNFFFNQTARCETCVDIGLYTDACWGMKPRAVGKLFGQGAVGRSTGQVNTGALGMPSAGGRCRASVGPMY